MDHSSGDQYKVISESTERSHELHELTRISLE
jgi:hypothetical protein